MKFLQTILVALFGASWRTTLIGYVTAAAMAAAAFAQSQGTPGWALVAYIMAIGIAALGHMAKDSSVTGGTVAATGEAVQRVGLPAKP